MLNKYFTAVVIKEDLLLIICQSAIRRGNYTSGLFMWMGVSNLRGGD